MGREFCKFKTWLKKVKQADSARADSPGILTCFTWRSMLINKIETKHALIRPPPRMHFLLNCSIILFINLKSRGLIQVWINYSNGHSASAEESQNSWAVCPCTVCLLTFCEPSFEFAELAPHWYVVYAHVHSFLLFKLSIRGMKERGENPLWQLLQKEEEEWEHKNSTAGRGCHKMLDMWIILLERLHFYWGQLHNLINLQHLVVLRF